MFMLCLYVGRAAILKCMFGNLIRSTNITTLKRKRIAMFLATNLYDVVSDHDGDDDDDDGDATGATGEALAVAMSSHDIFDLK